MKLYLLLAFLPPLAVASTIPRANGPPNCGSAGGVYCCNDVLIDGGGTSPSETCHVTDGFGFQGRRRVTVKSSTGNTYYVDIQETCGSCADWNVVSITYPNGQLISKNYASGTFVGCRGPNDRKK